MTVEISPPRGSLLPLPRVCAKTGTPTADTLTITGRAAPLWSATLMLFGFLPWLVASWASSRPYTVTVPLKSLV
jgi:hypothetical protein